MVNPYYYFFYFFYKVLKPIAKEEDRIPFAAISLMALILIIHSVILLISIKSRFGIEILPDVNKLVFGAIVTLVYLVGNHFLFERNNRYLSLVNRIEKAAFYKKVITSIILVGYFLSPLIFFGK